MGVRTFPALGFDPAPGSPAALLAQAREADRAARALAGRRPRPGGWMRGGRGRAAEATGSRPGLPGTSARGRVAHGTLARELTAYADDLAARQLRAADLEARAAALRAQGRDCGRAARRARRRGPRPAPATEPVERCRPGGGGRAGDRRGGRTADGEHRAAAARSATRIRAAAAVRRTGARAAGAALGLGAGLDRRHAAMLSRIAGGLRSVSVVLGTASLVPGFQFLAPIASPPDGRGRHRHAVAASTGHGSWTGMALDATLTALPTGPVARMVRRSRAWPGGSRRPTVPSRRPPAGGSGLMLTVVGIFLAWPLSVLLAKPEVAAPWPLPCSFSPSRDWGR